MADMASDGSEQVGKGWEQVGIPKMGKRQEQVDKMDKWQEEVDMVGNEWENMGNENMGNENMGNDCSEEVKVKVMSAMGEEWTSTMEGKREC